MGYQFTATCPHCQTQLQLNSDWIGMSVKCSQCNNEFRVEAPAAPQASPTSRVTPPVPPVPGQPMMPPPGQPGYPNKSTAALVLGIIGLVFSLILMPIGFILSLIALIIGCTKKYKPGIILGALGVGIDILLLALMLIIILPALDASRELARQASCMSNMKQLGVAFSMYASDNSDYMPSYKGKNGMESLQTGGYIFGGFDSYVNKCPSSKRNNPYAYVGEGLIQGAATPELPILVEYPTNHKDGRINVLHLGGHVSSHQLPKSCKTIYQATEYILEQNGIYHDNKYAAKVLKNAKKFK